jgi:sugar phosphate isomerase/epimerase
MPSLSRRRFFQWCGLTALAAPSLQAIEAFARKGPPRLRLGLAAYSFRDFFKYTVHAGATKLIHEERTLEMPGFIDYCAEQGCEGAELTSYYFSKDVTEAQLTAIRRHAFLRGVSITGTSVGNNFARPKGAELDAEIADVKHWIERAAVLGAPHIRVFAGAAAKGLSLEDAKKNCIAALEECCDYAGKRGIFLGLENHGGIVAEPTDLLSIVKAVQSPWLGINLDTGNFRTADPYAGLEACAPYAVNVQIKLEIQPAGAKTKQPADLARIVEMLRKANYQGWTTLEYESAEDPWKAVPVALARLKALLAGAAPAPAAEGQALFDGQSLQGWKPIDYGARGEVKVENGQIILGQGDPMTGIVLASEPPARIDYEVTLEAMRVEGDDFFCGLTVPVGDACGTLVVGGWGGSLIGFSSIDEMDASENSTTQFRKLDAGRWYRIRMRVTAKKIETWIDDERIFEAEIEGKKISMRPGEIEISQPFGLTSFRTKAALRDIRFRKL